MAANWLRRSALALPAVLALGACGELGTAPARPAAVAPPTEILGIALNNPGDTVSTSFLYTPAFGYTLRFGYGSKIIMPPNSVCDLVLSSYGAGEWDKPCVRQVAPFVVRVKAWMDQNGNPAVDFSPALRFVPTTDPRGFAQIVLVDPDASDATRAQWLNIMYAATPGATPVDEAAFDPSLRTYFNTSASVVWRRVKHFSGYNIPADRSGVPAQPADATEIP